MFRGVFLVSVDAYRSSIIVQYLTKLKSFVMLVADKFESEGFSTHTTNIQKIQYEKGYDDSGRIVVGVGRIIHRMWAFGGRSKTEGRKGRTGHTSANGKYSDHVYRLY